MNIHESQKILKENEQIVNIKLIVQNHGFFFAIFQ